MNIYQLLERIEKITEELSSVEGEFEELKKRYSQLNTRCDGLYCERQKLVQELASLCVKKC